jgi:AcrR family transcriptional regulator
MRRRRIIEAALDVFSELGFGNTTMEDIRIRSASSNGSIYHHFKSKEQLASAVYLEGIRDYQKGLVAAVASDPCAREGIVALVRYHMEWVARHNQWAKYLVRMRHESFMKDSEELLAMENAKFAEGVGAFVRKQISRGSLKPLPPDLFIAVLLGPCQEFVRLWLEGKTATDLSQACDALASAAWISLKAPAASD